MQLLYNRIESEYRLSLPTRSGIELVWVSEIVHCEAQQNRTKIYLHSGKSFLIKTTLKHLQSLLVSFDFIRVHNAHLINIHHVQRYIRSDGGYVELMDGTRLSVARSRKKELLSVMQ